MCGYKIWCEISNFWINVLQNVHVTRCYSFDELCGVTLTHWGRVTHICVRDLTSIGSDNGLSPGRRQVIIWTNAGILFIGPLGTNFSEILIEILTFSFKKMRLKLSSGKWRSFCLGLNVLKSERWNHTSLGTSSVKWLTEKLGMSFYIYINYFSVGNEIAKYGLLIADATMSISCFVN